MTNVVELGAPKQMVHLHSWAEPSGSSIRAAPTGTPSFHDTNMLNTQVKFQKYINSSNNATRCKTKKHTAHLRPSLNAQRQGPMGSPITYGA